MRNWPRWTLSGRTPAARRKPLRPPVRSHSIYSAVKAFALPVAAAIWAAIGTFWSIFAWYHQEVVIPKNSPVNVTADVTVQEAGTVHTRDSSGDEQLQAIQIVVTANNVSTKTVHLLSNYWYATAYKIAPRARNADGTAWLKDLNAAQTRQHRTGKNESEPSGRYYRFTVRDPVAWGNLFSPSEYLYPKEKISASVLFYVPKGMYDMVHVAVYLPTSDRPDLGLMYVFHAEGAEIKYFRIAPDGTRKEVTTQAGIDALRIQAADPYREISLGDTGETPASGLKDVEQRPAPPQEDAR